MKARNKTVVYTGNETTVDTDISKHIVIYPTIPGLTARMEEPPAIARKNNALVREKANYVYRIGNGDVLNAVIWNHNNLNSPTQQSNPQTNQVDKGVWMDERGSIIYPLTKQVQAKGKTIEELQSILAGRLKCHLENPQVAINVTEFHSQRIFVTSVVIQIRQQPTINMPLTILDAVNQVGGAIAEADAQNVRWVHNGVDRTISLQKFIQHGDLIQNHILSHGDITYILSNSNSKVFVAGEVGRQAALPLGSHDLTLTRTLDEVGGTNQPIVDVTSMLVIHRAFDDVQKPTHAYQLNPRDVTACAMGNGFNLHINDVVYVMAIPVACWNRVVSQPTNSITNVNSLDSTFH